MESQTLWVSFTLQKTRRDHDFMNRPKIELISQINLGWSIVYIKGLSGYNFQIILYFSSENLFVLANLVDPNEMSHYAEFHLDLYCF